MNKSENKVILIFANKGASTIPANTSTIRSGAFCGDTYNTPIKIPPSVTTIEPLAFDPTSELVLYSDVAVAPTGWANNWSNSKTSIVWNCSNALCEHGEDAYGGWTRSIETEPTCTQFGTMKRYCRHCNSAQTANMNPLGHDYQTIDEVAPTCTMAGSKTYECTRKICKDTDLGHTYTEEIPALGHDWSEWYSVIPSVCGHFGINERVCLTCGEREQQDSTDPGHIWSSENIITEPTCSAEGLIHKVCGECSTEVDEPIEKIPHAWGDWDITLPVTCTTDGVRRKTCSACSETVEETIESIGHRWSSNNKEVVQPTCVGQGYSIYYCINCGFARQTAYKDIDVLGHSYGAPTYTWNETNTACAASRICANDTSHVDSSNAHSISSNISKTATCSATGTKIYTAAFPISWAATQTKIETLAIDTSAHSWNAPTYTWSDYTACTGTRICIYNSAHTEITTGTITSVVTKEKTCTTDGTRTYTATFDKTWASNQTKTEAIPASHSYVRGLTTKPTCTTRGYTTYTCVDCGASYQDEFTPATGHSYTTKVTAPTCTARGYTTYTCTCGDSYRNNYVDALGHTEVFDTDIAATCTTAGKTEGKHCSVCNEVLVAQTTIPATGHSWNDPTYMWSADKTLCTATRTCKTDSEHKELAKATELAGEISSVVTKPATCAEKGIRTYTATFNYNTAGWAGRATTTEDIPATGHSYNTVVTAPTCTAQGHTTHTCSGCNDTYKDTYVAATGHKEILDPGVPATCTTSGMSAGSHCSVCNNILVPQTMIPATGHTYGNWVTTQEPTATATGTRQEICPYCDTVLSTETLPKRLLAPDSSSSVTVYGSTADGVILNAYATNTNDVDVRCYVTIFDYYGVAIASKEFDVLAKKNASINFTVSSLDSGSYKMYFAANGYSDSTAKTGTIS